MEKLKVLINRSLGILAIAVGAEYVREYLLAQQKKNDYDNLDGVFSSNLRRCKQKRRQNYEAILEEDGFNFYNVNGINWGDKFFDFRDNYWDDEYSYEISGKSEKDILEATYNLHNLCLEAVDNVCNDYTDTLFNKLEIPQSLRYLIRKSWGDKRPDLFGRFDLHWDGKDNFKMFEYNADTPTLILESSIIQNKWQQQVYPQARQCNYLEEAILKGFNSIFEKYDKEKKNKSKLTTMGFAIDTSLTEEVDTAQYLSKQIKKFGVESCIDFIEHFRIDYDQFNNEQNGQYLTRFYHKEQNKEIQMLWKLYPYEWINHNLNGETEILNDLASLNIIEPAWKLILGCKNILPLLWEMFPNHPNLIPTYYESDKDKLTADKIWVAKTLYGREGEHIYYSNNYFNLQEFILAATLKKQNYTDNVIFQEYCELPQIQKRYVQLSSWIVFGIPSGICFREDLKKTIEGDSNFVPHFINDKKEQFVYRKSRYQANLRKQIYGQENPLEINDLQQKIIIQEDDLNENHQNSRRRSNGGWIRGYKSSSSSNSQSNSQTSSSQKASSSYQSSQSQGNQQQQSTSNYTSSHESQPVNIHPNPIITSQPQQHQTQQKPSQNIQQKQSFDFGSKFNSKGSGSSHSSHGTHGRSGSGRGG